MARKIDLTKTLSAEDRQYLVDRDRWHDLARADGHEDPAQARRDAEARRAAPSQPALPPTDPQAPAVQRVPEDQSVDTDEEEDYSAWTYQELQAELKDRRAAAIESGMSEAEADERYKAGGKQAELIKRLEADDASASAEE